MSTQEIKIEITRLLDGVSDATLEKVLNYLKEVSLNKNSDKLQLLEKIFEKDKNLLKRLSE